MNEANDPYATKSAQSEGSPADAAPSDQPSQLGRYRIEKVLGEGGFGRVYLAHDDQLNRSVAIKVPRRQRFTRPEDAEAYLAEARVLASLDHPHIVPVHDVGTSDGLCYVVSKLIEGSDLARRIREARPSPAQAADLVATVAEALHYAHRKGLVHRDIKPGNILLDTSGQPYVADFGLALKEADFGKGSGFAGTPAYMSPEQARGEGHRVDGRSDIFSLGVVFYELLTGRRPFLGDTQSDLLEQITAVEVRPPRQVDDTIPRELERICLKALAKRASERYTTAKDLAEDLRHFLEHTAEGQQPTVSAGVPVDAPTTPAPGFSPTPTPPATPTPFTPASDQRPFKIVPKGLRSFDAGDADFFLELLPGPRDRDGLPDSIRFWKGRIEEVDADRTFGVGLIYGPSGCGKSSLVKAGLLPRLADRVLAVYVEATAEETEARLLKGLRKRCPDLAVDLGLAETLASLRRGRGVPAGKKVVIVLDQFEQWLHARRAEENTELVQALRQCDGERVQALVLVRDDFWLAVSRFMASLEVELLQGRNTALVDLFDLRHAKKVLAAFGRAFGALPEGAGTMAKDQAGFLDQAVAGLAQEGKVVSVRLALFAEMVKGKPWTPATLKEVGGMEGVGVSFLEETFSSRSAQPRHRLHQQGARAILKALLPEQGTDIKGHMRSEDELREASGYGGRAKDFEDLLKILDGEVRLITPTDPEGMDAPVGPGPAAAGGKYYQLTHDYLVPSLRAWLTRKQKETRRGRAELRLAERAALWQAKPENRHLPAWWEWLNIRLLTRKKDWTSPQRKMMRKATRFHAVRGLALAVCLMVLGWGSWEGFGRLKAQALRERLLNASTADVPLIVADMSPYRRWVNPLLRAASAQAEANHDGRTQLHASLALLPVDPGQVEYLYRRLLDAEPQETAVIRDALVGHKDELTERLWTVVHQPDKGRESQRLRAACALAAYDPDNPRWDKAAGPVVEQLVGVNPLVLGFWMEGLRPVKARLLAPLADVFRDRKEERTGERSLATNILADYAADQADVLADLVQDGDEKQFLVLYPRLETHRERAVAVMRDTVSTTLESKKTDADKEVLAKRQANAAVVLLRLGQAEAVWPLLKHPSHPQARAFDFSDPRVRSYLIHRLSPLGADPQAIIKQLDLEKEVSIRRALVLILGEFGPDQLTLADRAPLLPKVVQLYRDDPDAGLHGAAEWLLRQWGQQDKIKEFEQGWAQEEQKQKRKEREEQIQGELAKDIGRGEGYWYVTGQGQTMVVIPGPVEFLMGSPPTEEGRLGGPEGNIEQQHRKRIGRSFAVAAKEVTVGQFGEFLKSRKESIDAYYNHQYSPTVDCPVNDVLWYDAAAYCNWLSEQEGIAKDQWCYEANAEGKYAEGMKLAPDYLEREGYRLPSEAEWEYACRAGAVTSRYYGETEELLGKYAWYTKNSLDRGMLPGVPGKLRVRGDSLKPNDLGLFDMLGNAAEWCQESIGYYAPGENGEPSEDIEDKRDIKDKLSRVLRGGSFSNRASSVRSAYRTIHMPSNRFSSFGFRAARTFR